MERGQVPEASQTERIDRNIESGSGARAPEQAARGQHDMENSSEVVYILPEVLLRPEY